MRSSLIARSHFCFRLCGLQIVLARRIVLHDVVQCFTQVLELHNGRFACEVLSVLFCIQKCDCECAMYARTLHMHVI